jgi:hypothetical protein
VKLSALGDRYEYEERLLCTCDSFVLAREHTQSKDVLSGFSLA